MIGGGDFVEIMGWRLAAGRLVASFVVQYDEVTLKVCL